MSASATRTRPAVSAPRGLRLLRRILLRPETTAVIGTVAVFVYFTIAAGDAGFLSQTSARNTLEVAAQIGIIAAPMTLLLVAGEFDLSVGAVVAASQVLVAYLLVDEQWPVWSAVLVTCAVCAAIGCFNGFLVVRTRVPSFIITLGALFWVRGTTQGLTEGLHGGTTISGVYEQAGTGFFTSLFGGSVGGYPAACVWFLVIVLLSAWILDRTAVGNRIYATGGNLEAARRAGVASDRLKVKLYVCTAVAAGIVGILGVFQINQGDANAGVGLEFQTVTAAVIGGAALWGGFGSPLGAGIGALLFGMVAQGFFFTNVPDVWYQTFLGVILVLAVVINEHTRSILLRSRRRA
ncbi:MAG TPA: ABC transporter permease [Conexibacter sp.]|nr:ABC transporter permease [Conexibacter sp.]